MTIAVVQDFDGATLAQYDAVIDQMGLAPGGKHPDPGCLFHWVTQTGDGLRVVDVWESQEQFDEFITEQVIPLANEAGYPNPPRIATHEIHAYFH